jgi:S-(hydroxymethyl)glutathione dehydrogenase/alcohol dehydrogenase
MREALPAACKAIVADGAGGFALAGIGLAPPRGREVAVRMMAAGLCHTDVDAIRSWKGPFVAGHEGAGVVAAVGDDVTRFRVGDRVILNWAIPCRTCPMCERGLMPLCETSSPANGDGTSGKPHPGARLYRGAPIESAFNLGTMAEYAMVVEDACQPLLAGVPFAVGAIMGCAVMTGYGSVMNAARVTRGATVAVLGCGGIGLNVIQAAAIAGAGRIIAIDIAQDRLARARDFGATHTLVSQAAPPGFAELRQSIDAIVPGGADYAFECTGVAALGPAPLALVRHGGTAVQVSGIEQTVPFDCTLFEWDKTYINPLYGQCDPDRDFPILQRHYLSGALNLDAMISRSYPLTELGAAMDDLAAGRIAKAVLDPQGAA